MHLETSLAAADSTEPARPSMPVCRESISQRTLAAPTDARLRFGQAAKPTPLDRLGRELLRAESIPEIIAILACPHRAADLLQVRRISLAAASGQADAVHFQTICAHLAQRCRNLEQLDVADAVLSTPAALALASLPALTVLALNTHACEHRRRRPLPDGVLEHLAQSPRLRTLMLGNADLPVDGVAPLHRLTSLRSLSLSNCAFLAHDVDSLSTLHRLEVFQHRGDEDCSAIAKAVSGLLHLESLYLAKFRLDGKTIDIGALHALRQLRRLHVDEALVTQASLRALGKGATVLTELELNAPNIGINALSALQFFTFLKTLHIEGEVTGVQPLPGPMLALRKHRLEQVWMPGAHLAPRSRRALMLAFSPYALSYTTGPRSKAQKIHAYREDHRWLVKHGMLYVDTPAERR